MSTTAKQRPATFVLTGKVRLSYPHLFEARAMEGETVKKFGCAILIPKSDTETVAKINAAIEAAKQEGKASKWAGKIPGNLKTPLRDGDIDKPEDDAYAGHYFLNCNSGQKPGIVDANRNDIIEKDEIYAGCYVRVTLVMFAFAGKANGVAAGLNNVQKLADGDPLAGRSRAQDDFADEAEDDLI